MTTEDAELVERLQKGDLEAFDRIYSIYAGRLYSFGLKYIRTEAEAEELVQSVFLKVWENHANLDKELSFKAYLFTIAYNDICKFFRRKEYLRKYVSEVLYTDSPNSSESEESIDFRSVLDHVQEITDKLPEKVKTAFIRSKLEGKQTREIASEMGLSPGTVDNYISDAVKFIKTNLGKENLSLLLFFSLFIF